MVREVRRSRRCDLKDASLRPGTREYLGRQFDRSGSSAPVITGMRLRAGKAGSGKGAGRMVTQAVVTARKAGAAGTILVRGDSAYGTRSVVTACLRAKVEFSVVMAKNTAVARAIDSIADETWTPVKYPGAVRDPDTGAWISDAEVAETTYTAFASSKNPVTARVDRAPSQRCAIPGRVVSPSGGITRFHQHHRAHRRRRCHPPSARDHRNRVRRSH